jgi:hypothetical protein
MLIVGTVYIYRALPITEMALQQTMARAWAGLKITTRFTGWKNRGSTPAVEISVDIVHIV